MAEYSHNPAIVSSAKTELMNPGRKNQETAEREKRVDVELASNWRIKVKQRKKNDTRKIMVKMQPRN